MLPPKVDVRGAVFRDGKILLVREKMDGGWTMPGGWADVGDSPALGAEREVWEESGFRVKARKVIGVYEAPEYEWMVVPSIVIASLCAGSSVWFLRRLKTRGSSKAVKPDNPMQPPAEGNA